MKHVLLSALLFLLTAAAVLCTGVTAEAADAPDGTITVLDYGPARMEGDAVLLESDGHYLLMDTGYTDKEKNIGQSSVILWLKAHNVRKLDLYLSHYHNDHYFLLTTIMKDPYFTVGTVYLPDASHMLPYTARKYKRKGWYHDLTKNVHGYGSSWEKHSYTELKNVIKSRKIHSVTLKKGSTFDVGNAHCEVLWQCRNRKPSGGNAVQYINNTSLVTRVTIGQVRYLTAGDIHMEVESDMVKAGVDLKADIVKTNHHSYNTSNTASYYKAIKADWAFSTGGFSKRTKDAFAKTGTNYVAMKRNGTITFTITGSQIDMSAGKNLTTREIQYEAADGTRHTKTVCFASGIRQFLTDSMIPEGASFLGTPGWGTFNGNTCYYDEEGRLLRGQIAEIDGNYYYFRLRDGKLLRGWLTIKGEAYHTDDEGRFDIGWKEIDDKIYYFHPDGHRQTDGELTVGGAHGTFDDQGVLTSVSFDSREDILPFFTGFTSIGDDRFYCVRGECQTGLQTISKKTYLFDDETGAMLFGLQTANGKYYYLDAETGAARTGWITEDLPGLGLSTEGTIVWADTASTAEGSSAAAEGDPTTTEGGTAGTEAQETPRPTTRTFYGNKNGVLLTGWQTVEKKRRYFYPNALMQPQGTAQIGEGTGVFDKDGALEYITYASEDQIPAKFTGIVRIDGTEDIRYCLKSGKKQKGWQTVNGNKYYFNSKYKMVFGHQKIARDWCFFDQDTGILQTGWIEDRDGNWYRADSKGRLKSGWQTISKKKYYFSVKTHKMSTGKCKVSKNYYFFDVESGALVLRSWAQDTDGAWYITDKNGILRTGWITSASRSGKCYIDPRTRAMVTGFQTISGKEYYFEPSDGHMETGIVTIDNVTYEFASDGVLMGVVDTPPQDPAQDPAVGGQTAEDSTDALKPETGAPAETGETAPAATEEGKDDTSAEETSETTSETTSEAPAEETGGADSNAQESLPAQAEETQP